ncbi:MAG: ATP-binding protein [Rhodobacterales bacterium]|nr:ATP-binding protein [Rhodobacterales bacterium]
MRRATSWPRLRLRLRRRGVGAAAGRGCEGRAGRPPVSRSAPRRRARRPRGAPRPHDAEEIEDPDRPDAGELRLRLPAGDRAVADRDPGHRRPPGLVSLETAHRAVSSGQARTARQGIRSAEAILIQGPPGVGKSHLLVGLGVRAIQLGFSVQYFRFDELLTALKVDAHLRPERLKKRKYMSSALLLVDEMGYDPMTREEASLFFRLVSYRYGRGAMIITTNKSIRDWTELLAGDEVLATAILDRLLHRAHVLNIKGRSYRLRDLEDAFKT